MRRFLDGLLFGAGFAVAFLSLSYVAAYFVYPLLIEHLASGDWESERRMNSAFESSPTIAAEPNPSAPAIPFHELPLEKQIDGASAIVLTKFQAAKDGQQKAIVVEYIKGAPTAKFPYEVGEEMAGQSYYPKPGESRGDGEVVLFVGRSEISQMSFPYEGDRLNAFGAMPLKLLREKCKPSPDA